MKNILKILLLTVCFHYGASCKQKKVADGGPCSYETSNYPATIIGIFEQDSIWNDIFFVLNREGEIDTLMYSQEFQSFISMEEIQYNNFKVGDTLSYEHMQITSGHCTPDIFKLTKERYKK